MRVFVYGTLMSGQRANHFLSGTTLIGKFRLADYAMYNLGSYPGIRPLKGESVVGEVYEIPEEILPQLDRYEGEGSLYHRIIVEVSNEIESTNAYAYLYQEDVACKPMRLAWGVKENDFVWYACYGSNLSAQRFECYIKGGVCTQNNKTYIGCKDKSHWQGNLIKTYKGRMYFGNESHSWGRKGVAFFDYGGEDTVIMRLYKITIGQLLELQEQEGNSPNWYGRLLCLDVLADGCPVYTITSEKLTKENVPSNAYIELIKKALIEECSLEEADAIEYLDKCMKVGQV